jgi:putative transposase
MKFAPYHLYHIYNQGNNQQQLFFNRENYLYFLKINKEISPLCEIFAWCLMPNHFHFLIGTNEDSAAKIKIGGLEMSKLSNAIRLLESSYTRAINNQEKKSGSLFRQKTKAKCLTEEAFFFDQPTQKFAPDFFNNYPMICFQYIHQNPIAAKLVENSIDWEFSSLRDYLNVREGKLCNYELCQRWIGVDKTNITNITNMPSVFNPDELRAIF